MMWGVEGQLVRLMRWEFMLCSVDAEERLVCIEF